MLGIAQRIPSLKVIPVMVMALSVSACSNLAGPFNALFIPDEGYRTNADIAYGELPRQKLDIYLPAEDGDGRDVIIFLYGGSWKTGDRSHYRFLGEALTSRDFIAVVPDYRLFPEVRYPAFVEDAAAVLAWVQANIHTFGGDSARIFLVGHSAGAHIAAMLITEPSFLADAGVDPEVVRGFVGLAGPYAIDPLDYNSIREVFATGDQGINPRPVSHVTGAEPPMLLLHGEDDHTVNPANSLALEQAIAGAGGDVTLVSVPDTGHIGIILAFARPFQAEGGVLDQVGAWVTSH
jgi:acetyl esterase/lipase